MNELVQERTDNMRADVPVNRAIKLLAMTNGVNRKV